MACVWRLAFTFIFLNNVIELGLPQRLSGVHEHTWVPNWHNFHEVPKSWIQLRALQRIPTRSKAPVSSVNESLDLQDVFLFRKWGKHAKTETSIYQVHLPHKTVAPLLQASHCPSPLWKAMIYFSAARTSALNHPTHLTPRSQFWALGPAECDWRFEARVPPGGTSLCQRRALEGRPSPGSSHRAWSCLDLLS